MELAEKMVGVCQTGPDLLTNNLSVVVGLLLHRLLEHWTSRWFAVVGGLLHFNGRSLALNWLRGFDQRVAVCRKLGLSAEQSIC